MKKYKNINLIIFAILILMFFWLLFEISEDEVFKLDSISYRVFVETLRNYPLLPIMSFFTFFGSSIALIILSIVFSILIKNKRISLSICLNLLISFLLNILLKNVICRVRPTGYNLINVTGYSFPSGHSMVSMAFYGFLIYLIYKYVKNKKLKTFFIILLSLLIIFIGISRIYLGVHYASDVLAGFVFSIAYLIIYIKLINYYMKV